MLKDLESMIDKSATCKNIIGISKYRRYTRRKGKRTSPTQSSCKNFYLCFKCAKRNNRRRALRIIELLVNRKILVKNTDMKIKAIVESIEKAIKNKDIKKQNELNSLVDFGNNSFYHVTHEGTKRIKIIEKMKKYSDDFIINTHYCKYTKNELFVRYSSTDDSIVHQHVILLNPKNIETFPIKNNCTKIIPTIEDLFEVICYILKYPLQDYFIKRSKKMKYPKDYKPILNKELLDFYAMTIDSKALKYGIFSPAFKTKKDDILDI